ncbi:unnamed protein product [Effrenium voratum]|nr:unnamed protein product [Effrenium voratum]
MRHLRNLRPCLARLTASAASQEGAPRKLLGVSKSLSVPELAGALLEEPLKLRRLEAIGHAPLSTVLKALAMCNRRLEGKNLPCLGFVPWVRVYVHRPDEASAHVRRSMRLQLREVSLDAVQQVRAKLAAEQIDVVRVRADTDLRRLSGLVHSRFQLSAIGLGDAKT